MSDLSFKDYLSTVQERCSRSGWQKMCSQVKQSPKYQGRHPVDFEGITLMTPMGNFDPHASELYTHLSQVQALIKQKYKSTFIPVPEHTFHITGADLIAGPRFEEYIKQSSSSETYIEHVKETLLSLPLKHSLSDTLNTQSSSCSWSYYGLTLFETALVALLVPRDKESYQSVIHLRNTLYSNEAILDMGIRRPLPFMAHVTLAYFDGPPPYPQLKALTEDLLPFSKESLNQEITYTWSCLQLHRFPHMEVYHGLPLSFLLSSNALPSSA